MRRGASGDGGATLDFETDDIVNPKAALFIVSRSTDLDTISDNATMSVGATDGTRDRGHGCYVENLGNPTNALSHADDVVGYLMDGSGGQLVEAKFSQWLTNGVQISFTSAPGERYFVTCVLISSDLAVKVGSDSSSATLNATTTVTTGIANSVLIFFGGIPLSAALGTLYGVDNPEAQLGLGFADINASTINQCNSSWASGFGQIVRIKGKGGIQNDRVLSVYSATLDSTLAAIEVTAISGTGFTVTTRDAALGMQFGYLALELPSDVAHEIAVVTSPDTTSNAAYPLTMTQTPQFLLQGSMLRTSLGSSAGVDSSTLCLAAYDASVQAGSTINVAVTEGIPSVAQSNSHEGLLVPQGNGDVGLAARLSGFFPGEYQLDFTDTMADFFLMTALVIGEGGIVGQAEGSLTLDGTCDGVGRGIGSSSGAAHLNAGTNAGTGLSQGNAPGTANIDGTGAGTAINPGSSSGTAHLNGTSDGTAARNGSASGTANIDGTGSGIAAGISPAVGTMNLEGSSDGVGMSYGAASGALDLVAIVDGTAAFVGEQVKPAKMNLLGSSSGSAAINGACSDTLHLQGASSGVGVGLGTVAGVMHLDGVAVLYATATSAASGTLHLYGEATEESTLLLGLGFYTQTSGLVRLQFNALIAEALPVETAWDNAPFHATRDYWVEASVEYDDTIETHTGLSSTNSYKTWGKLVVDVVQPVGSGEETIQTIINAIESAFTLLSYGRIKFDVPSVANVGRRGAKWITRVTCPFHTSVDVVRIVGGARTNDRYGDIKNAIRSRFESLIVPQGILIQYDDEEDSDYTVEDPHVRLYVLTGDKTQAESKTFRTIGVVIAQVRVPAEDGDFRSLEIVDKIKDAMRCVSASGITYRTPRVQKVGRVNNWWINNVLCPYYSDFIRT